jgi:hypothetical protein
MLRCRARSVTPPVVLAEVGARREQDERLLLAELMVQHAREPRVGPLGHPRGVLHRDLLLGVVVHEEVLGLEHPPVEPVVLHLVLTEIALCAGARGERRPADEAQRRRRGPSPEMPHVSYPL